MPPWPTSGLIPPKRTLPSAHKEAQAPPWMLRRPALLNSWTCCSPCYGLRAKGKSGKQPSIFEAMTRVQNQPAHETSTQGKARGSWCRAPIPSGQKEGEVQSRSAEASCQAGILKHPCAEWPPMTMTPTLPNSCPFAA